ncbi:hypothetical protein U3653_31480 [Nocardia sp. CDC186]|uniref:Uncharacterized protein n=1 Tax=Nocardia implantans TaxID=3108168 RepID=A0ABU6B4E9_9NOCA|nr:MULTISPECIES: hypothetical protein [unclassified Nocardia]MEA3527728.1 hypothetical protein [Nocardia sp. CDC192]MEB3514566.1 hypothetical protein [Nocardia sp. CDC186]
MGGAFGEVRYISANSARSRNARRAMPSSAVSKRGGVGEGAHTDSLLAEVVDEVQHFAQVPSEPVAGVGDDGVAGACVFEQFGQTGPVDGRAGLRVDVDPLIGQSGVGEGVEIAFEALLGGRDSGVAEFESAGRSVRGLSERFRWNDSGTNAVPVRPGRCSLAVDPTRHQHTPHHGEGRMTWLSST